jgi:ferrous iron transport protein B
LVGNPNAGKTTLFNALTGLRAKTANFPGTTVESRTGRVTLGGEVVELLDLPGLYSLGAATPEETIARDALMGAVPGLPRPDVALLIVDATNLERNLFLASQVLELKVPTVVALNMIDLADRAGIKVDAKKLARELGCPVVPVSARLGKGMAELRQALELVLDLPVEAATPKPASTCATCGGCPFQARYDWAEKVGSTCATGDRAAHGRKTERIDKVLTHPVVGVLAFLAVMFGVFLLIFSVARYPMDLIDVLFAHIGRWVNDTLPLWAAHLPAGGFRAFVETDLRSLLVKGVIGGVGGMLVFLPQICILFFFLSLLEDTGYLARAAFVMDKLMRRVGLPGKAFVPLLSAHACAIPGIMATRVIDDKRDRLVTILIAPLMSCSARIPVYTMLVWGLLYPHSPLKAAGLFTGAYLLGISAALGMAWVFKHTILRGESKPLVLELPSYKTPSLRNAVLMSLDRARVFVVKAGTMILLVSVLLWALATYPKSSPPAEAVTLRQQARALQEQGKAPLAGELENRAEQVTAQSALAHSFAGRFGRLIEPAIRPLGYDWQIGVGIFSSFAAREVIVSTLAVVYGVGDKAAEENPNSLYDTLRQAKRSDGTPVFTFATCLSLLVFYVLAMQCLATQAVTRRETNSLKWPVFQFVYMSVLAYAAALLAFQSLHFFGVA